MTLPTTLYTCKQVRALDKATIEQQGVAGFELMLRAGHAAFDLICKSWPEERRLYILCGGGNNGGDGYVIAALAAEQGFEVQLLSLAETEELTGDARQAYEFARNAGLATGAFDVNNLHKKPPSGVVVDAMLGIGLTGKVRGKYVEAIRWLNRSRLPVLSVDIPSGLDGNTGVALGCAVRADSTITFIGTKQGLLTADSKNLVGKLYFADLEIDQTTLNTQTPSAQRIEFELPLLQPREGNSNKGQFGRLLVLGGGAGMGGAAIMSAESGLLAGAGIVNLATHGNHLSAALSRRPELMVIDFKNEATFDSLLEQATVLVVGPGLGRSKSADLAFKKALQSNKPMVIDADGLNRLADLSEHRDNWVLTPHPGEAARLLACTTSEIQANRFAAVRALQSKYGGTVILKGAGSLVADNESIYVCDKGNSAMSAPGMGDILAGLIGGLLAQQLSLSRASRVAVWAHAYAGDLAADSYGRHLMATDLYPFLRKLW